jgi:hypothetical protein
MAPDAWFDADPMHRTCVDAVVVRSRLAMIARFHRTQLLPSLLLCGVLIGAPAADLRAQSSAGAQAPAWAYPPAYTRPVEDPFSPQAETDNVQIMRPEDFERCRAEALRQQSQQRYEEAKSTRQQPTTPLTPPPDCDPSQVRSEPPAGLESHSEAERDALEKAAAAEAARKAAAAEARRQAERRAAQVAERKRRMSEVFDLFKGGLLDRAVNGGYRNPLFGP